MKTIEEIEHLVYSCFGEKEWNNVSTNAKLSLIQTYTKYQNDMLHDQTVTRFEVIDENGRAYTQRDCNVELSYQDDGRTLKVFIKRLNKQN